MSYTPNTWKLGDIITPQKLNNIEQGILNAGYDAIVHYYKAGNTSDPAEITIKKGSYSSILELINNNVPPNILVQIYDQFTNLYCCTNAVAIYSIDSGSSDPFVMFSVRIPVPSSNIGSDSSFINNVMRWFASNEVTFG